MKILEAHFDEVKEVWEKHLWPNRKSPIKTHSSLCFLEGHDMRIYDNPVFFFKVLNDKDEIIGVNSCFQTGDHQFRSRGLYVFEDYRGQKVAKLLLEKAKEKAKEMGAREVWSMPRKGSEFPYLACGFELVGQWFDEGVEFGPNIFCLANI